MRLCFFFFAFVLFRQCRAELCNPDDKQALLQIKKDFGNPYLLASWKEETDCCTSWYQVECDSTTNRITSLTVFSGTLSGHLPAAIGDLPYLKTLDFNHLSDVTGPVQPAIAKLTQLRFLRLSKLNLTGAVPAFLGNLSSLTFLDLSFNMLSGVIPSELAMLPNLTALHLDRNRLTGSIPSEFGNLFGTSSPSIYLSHNRLSGPIPSSFDKLTASIIDLSRNALSGDPSVLFGSTKVATSIDISRNNFAFNLSNVILPPGLYYLDMNHNGIFGGLSSQWTQLDMQFLNVSYNRLCGQIPVGGKLQSFDASAYFHNKCLCGSPLPICH